jgi:hypothetical protein
MQGLIVKKISTTSLQIISLAKAIRKIAALQHVRINSQLDYWTAARHFLPHSTISKYFPPASEVSTSISSVVILQNITTQPLLSSDPSVGKHHVTALSRTTTTNVLSYNLIYRDCCTGRMRLKLPKLLNDDTQRSPLLFRRT